MKKRLTQKAAQAAQPKAKPYQISDPVITGLALRVQPNGRKFWKYRANGKITSLGGFPQVTASMALAKLQRIASGEEEAAPAQIPTVEKYLSDYFGEWVHANHGKPRETLAIIRSFKMGRRRLDEIKIADIEKWRTRRRKEVCDKTVNRNTAIFKASLQKAVEWDLIEVNPLARLKPLKTDRGGVIRYLDSKEEGRLYRALEGVDGWLKAITITALHTGCRRGELWNLRWQDVDFKKRLMVVRGDVSRGERTKSKQTRFIPLNPTAVEALKEWRGDVRPLPAMPVFGKHEFRKRWRSLMGAADIENFTFHCCRHSFASRLVQSGVDLNVARELLGHQSLRMTLRYSHLRPRDLQKAVELIG